MISSSEPKPPSVHTLAANARVAEQLMLDPADEERSQRGLIATHPTGIINHEHGVAFDVSRLDFVRRDEAAPDSVNPSLWRHMTILRMNGLFKLAEGIWQVRGFDLSNMTVIAGKTGWILIDPDRKSVV